jgi:catechol 2,3-dioxygenase-like lactoylglutathione lyase family enzyme
MKTRYLDHIDLRVRNFARAKEFYRKLLPPLGFSRDRSDAEWGTFYTVGGDQPPVFFGFTEDPGHKPNGIRISFWADSRTEVDKIGELVREIGGQNIEGPEVCAEYSPGYYAVFFEDPDGNKLEVCYREQPVIEK